MVQLSKTARTVVIATLAILMPVAITIAVSQWRKRKHRRTTTNWVSSLTELDSTEGKRRLRDSQLRGSSQNARLMNNHKKQRHPCFCGVTTTAIVLSTVRTGKPFQEVKMFDDLPPEFADKLSYDRAASSGVNLKELSLLMQAHGLQTQLVHANESSVDDFRSSIVEHVTESSSTFVVPNFLLRKLGYEAEGGHISPLSAYDEVSDSVLLLDVWPSYPFVWVAIPHLFQAMQTMDESAGAFRGFVVVSDGR